MEDKATETGFEKAVEEIKAAAPPILKKKELVYTYVGPYYNTGIRLPNGGAMIKPKELTTQQVTELIKAYPKLAGWFTTA